MSERSFICSSHRSPSLALPPEPAPPTCPTAFCGRIVFHERRHGAKKVGDRCTRPASRTEMSTSLVLCSDRASLAGGEGMRQPVLRRCWNSATSRGLSSVGACLWEGRTQVVNLGRMGQYLVFTFLCKLANPAQIPIDRMTCSLPSGRTAGPAELSCLASHLPLAPYSCHRASYSLTVSCWLKPPHCSYTPSVPSHPTWDTSPLPYLLQPPASLTSGSVSQLPL